MDVGPMGWVALIGGFLLLAAIGWSMFRNRQETNPGDLERTERATHDLYDAEQTAHRDEDNRGV